uniref:Uncharacterized protein n=1 Tax=Anguilla anguilla TaxID=7936 RepID=A0A0E9VQ67_ANGAN
MACPAIMLCYAMSCFVLLINQA